MKISLSLTFIASLMVFVSCTSDKGTDYDLYYLGGQSNMDGYGYISDIPAISEFNIEGLMIFHGNAAMDDAVPDGKGKWSLLQAGHGVGFSSDGENNNYSERFGVELSFAEKLIELKPESNIAILKYSKGGTSIDVAAAGTAGSWDPGYKDGKGINQFDHFQAALKNALLISDIDGDAKKDRFIPAGIIWMQGESDGAYTEDIANRYNDNLDKLISSIRNELGDMELPVVIGRISDSGNNPSGKVWEFGEIVRTAQQTFSEKDNNAALVRTTDNYLYSDPWHYDSEAYLDLGREFALKLDSLRNR